jgi:hypothetical protein
MKMDKMYLEQLSLTDLDEGEPVYLGDDIFILPDGSIVDSDSEDYKHYWSEYYGTRGW